MAGRFILGQIKPEDLGSEFARAGGPALYSEAEWDVIRSIRLRCEGDSKGAAALLLQAGEQTKAARGWPHALAKGPTPAGTSQPEGSGKERE